MLKHGGDLRRAARIFGDPPGGWLDLSTGINPHPWPVPAQPLACWSRLSGPEEGLIEAAHTYYDSSHVLPVAGSQAAIQALPALRRRCHVGILAPAYAEHARAWRRGGHRVSLLDHIDIDHPNGPIDVLVVINPGNPTGLRVPRDLLLQWHARLASRGGWLIVDEAFMDPTPDESLAATAAMPGLIVLRSFGKFFGLAGARVGFVIAEERLLRRLAERLGPWTLAGPSVHVAMLALGDVVWQKRARWRLRAASQRLARLLALHDLPPRGGTGLFQWVQTGCAARLHSELAQRGILTRRFSRPDSLRFGLPGTEADWLRLEQALAMSRAVLPVRAVP